MFGGDPLGSAPFGGEELGVAAAAATAINLAGPSSGHYDAASTNFTATPNGTYTGTILVTPTSSVGADVFTPTSANSVDGAAVTFTVTPSSIGSRNINCTNNAGLTPPSDAPYSSDAYAPGQVTAVTATAGANSISVNGTPGAAHGAAITQYNAALSTGETASSATLPIVFTGLFNGATATATLSATNSADTGIVSDPSSAATPATSVHYKMVVTVDNNYPAAPALSLSQINLALTASNAASLFTNAKNDGSDIVVKDADGTTALNFWLEAYDPVLQTASLWIKTPVSWLAQGASTTIQLHYGNTGAGTGNSSYSNTMQKFDATDSACLCCLHMDEGSGTPVDSSAVPYTCTNIGSPTWGGGDGGNFAAQSPRQAFGSGSFQIYNGSSSAVKITGLFDTVPASGMIAFWFRPDTANPTAGALFGKDPADYEGLYVNFTGSGAIRSIRYTGALGVSAVTIDSRTVAWASGTWHHYCYAWSPSLLRVFIDGVLENAHMVDTVNSGGNIGKWGDGSRNAASLGCQITGAGHTNGSFFTGAIDEFIALNRCPLPEEVRAHYKRRKYQQGQEMSGRLTKQGTVLSPTGGGGDPDSNQVIEISVIKEAAPNSWSAFYSGWPDDTGAGSTICRATGTDGIAWTHRGSVIGGGVISQYSCVLDDLSGVRRCYYAAAAGASIRLRTSTDLGVTWSAATTLFSKNFQSWCVDQVDNVQVWQEDATHWYMLLEGNQGGLYTIGLLTSTDGAAWTPYASNPLSTMAYRTNGNYSAATRPIKIAGTYYCFIHVDVGPTGGSCLACVSSTDLHTWDHITTDPVLMVTNEASAGECADQMADADIVELAAETRLYYETCSNSAIDLNWSRFEYANYAGTFSQLLQDAPASSFAAEGVVASGAGGASRISLGLSLGLGA